MKEPKTLARLQPGIELNDTLAELAVETVEKQKTFSHRSHSRFCYPTNKSVNHVPGLKRKRCPACTGGLSNVDLSFFLIVVLRPSPLTPLPMGEGKKIEGL
jgi:hypothetical protein